MSTPEPKFGYAFGTFATIMVLILDFLVILSSVSNCIVYNKIVSGEPNSDISVGWGRFMLAVNVIVAIFAFLIFFWILYILFTGKKSIGSELQKKREMGGIGNYVYDRSKDFISRFESNSQKVGELIRGSPQAAADAVNGLRSTGMSASDAGNVVTAAANGNPQAAAQVAAAAPGIAAAAAAAASGPNTVPDLYKSVLDKLRSTDSGEWDTLMGNLGGNCSDADFAGCSKELTCDDGTLGLPCGGTGINDRAINEINRRLMNNIPFQ